jgi:hypothetical protein
MALLARDKWDILVKNKMTRPEMKVRAKWAREVVRRHSEPFCDNAQSAMLERSRRSC